VTEPQPDPARPTTVTALNLLLILQAATAFSLAGLSIVFGIASWVTRGDGHGGGFEVLATLVAAMMAVFAVVVLAVAVLAWMALRARRGVARWLSPAVFVMPLVGVALVSTVRSPPVPALLLALGWVGLGAWLSLSGSTWNWLQRS
jgi:hypothetical protein